MSLWNHRKMVITHFSYIHKLGLSHDSFEQGCLQSENQTKINKIHFN